MGGWMCFKRFQGLWKHTSQRGGKLCAGFSFARKIHVQTNKMCCRPIADQERLEIPLSGQLSLWVLANSNTTRVGVTVVVVVPWMATSRRNGTEMPMRRCCRRRRRCRGTTRVSRLAKPERICYINNNMFPNNTSLTFVRYVYKIRI